MLFAVTLVSCNLDNKFENLKADVDTALPIGTYGITAKDFVDMLGVEVSDIVADKVIEITYADDAYNVIDENMIADIVKVEDQQNPGTFDLTSITDNITPGTSLPLVIDASVADVFSTNVSFTFKDGGRPTKVIFNRATISVDADTDMPTQNLEVEFEGVTKAGEPLRLKAGESKVLDGDYEMNLVTETGKDPYLMIKVKGSTTISHNSTLGVTVNLTDADVKYIEGDLERQIETNTTAFDLGDLSSGLDHVEEFYPENILFNLNIDNAFEALPMLVQMTKITFVNAKDGSKNVEIDIKNGLDVDRFFLKKGANTITIDNAISKSGKGLSDAFSKDLSAVNIEYTIFVNPTNADAMGEVPQDRNNKVLTDTKINSEAHFNVPLKGYIKGMAIDTVMQVNFDIKDLSVKKLQYNISAINSFPLDMEVSLVIMEKETNKILVEGEEPINIDGAGTLSYDVSNIRTLSGDAVDKLFRKDANLGVRIRGNSVGADNREIVSFLGGDNIKLNLFLGFNGVFTLVKEDNEDENK